MADRWDRRVAPLAPALLDRYLDFVDAGRLDEPSLPALAALQTAHLQAIPFENLSAIVGEPVSLEPAAVVEKLLSRTRGGYCFEHNLLFARVLRALGYDVELLAGRVLVGATVPRPHTHLGLRVRLEGQPILADVGYGRHALRGPLRLETGVEQTLGADRFRIMDEHGEFRLELHGADGWAEQYLLDPRPVYEIDCAMANHWVAAHPESTMKDAAVALKPTATGKRSLRGSRLAARDRRGRSPDRPHDHPRRGRGHPPRGVRHRRPRTVALPGPLAGSGAVWHASSYTSETSLRGECSTCPTPGRPS